MAHRILIVVAAAMLGGTPGLVRAGDALAELVTKIEALRVATNYADAAKLAADSAAREDLANDARVLLGGLARQNFELSYKNKGPITDLCGVIAVMRLVAPLDTPQGGAAKLSVAEDAKTRLEAATGQPWSAVCPAAGLDTGTGPDAATGPDTAAAPDTTASNAKPGDSAAGDAAGVRPDLAPPPARLTRRVQAGIGTLVPGVVLLAPFVGVLVYRADINRDLAALRAMTSGRPNTPEEENTGLALNRRFRGTTAAAAAIGTMGAALVLTGAILLATGGKPRRVALAPWGGRGIGGFVLQGRF